jgi:hypothetical protein
MSKFKARVGVRMDSARALGIMGFSSTRFMDQVRHRSRETRINLVFQFAPEKLGHFETKGWNFLVFNLKRAIFPIWPRAKFVRFTVVYG